MNKVNKRWNVLIAIFMLISLLTSVVFIKDDSYAAKVKLNQTKLNLFIGSEFQLKLNSFKKKIKWQSSNKDVASVDQKGKVVAKSEGTAKISAKLGKKKYSCEVTVTENSMTEEQVYSDIKAMEDKYPEGMKWNNDNYYEWKGGRFSGGMGCAAFAFLLSDAAFNNLPARKYTDYTKTRVGDIVRMNHDTHSVVVLEVHSDYLVVVEGNYNNSIHWGREISKSELKEAFNFALTRYPKLAKD